MSTAVKVLFVLGLVLPLGAFVAGSLAASGADDPGPRAPIVIPHQPRGSATPGGDGSPSDHRSDDGHHGDHHGGVGVITPSPDDIDDHGDDSGRDGELGDDHGGGPGMDDSGSGHSGGGSTSGSPGGSPGGSPSGSDDSGHGGSGHG